jgi:TATA-binding protein-associated factor
VELRPGLLFFTDSPDAVDDLISRQHGQDVIDSLSVLEAVVPTLHRGLWPKIRELFPVIVMALRSRFAIIRQSAARCFAAICDLMTVDAMRFVIEVILPYLGDTLVNSNRQGATEVVFSTCTSTIARSLLTYAYRRHSEIGS